jgi:putative ABC transport system permease protein
MMRTTWEEALRTAAQMVRAHKLRSTLTVLGVAIGVLSVVSVAAIIHGLNVYVDSKVQELGSNTFLVSRFPAFVRVEDWTEEIRQRKHLTAADARAIAAECRTCAIATPMLTRFPLFGYANEARFRNQRVDVPLVRGAEPAMTRAFPLFVVRKGRMFTDEENEHAARVCVAGMAIADSLFGPLDPLGRTLRLNGVEFQVIGVWERHQGLFGGPGLDQVIVIPYRTFTKLWPEIEEQILGIAAVSPAELPHAREEAIEILRRRRHVPPHKDNDFEVTLPEYVNNLWAQLTGAIVILTLIIASISLVVGGIGVMNIMLVSVTERTAEIGIRKAAGAQRADIRRQFLTEAVALTSFGGVLGVLLGSAVTYLTRWAFPDLPAEMSLFWVLTGFAMSVGVGLFFGIYPATRAAALDPVACLRYE